MKLKNLTALVGLVALLTGCSQDGGSVIPAPDNTPTTFIVNADDARNQAGTPASRAVMNDLTRYVMEIYEGDTPLATDAIPVQHIEQATGSFTVFLKDNTDYTVLFWADYDTPDDNVNSIFNAADLKKVSINPAKDALKPAWSGVEQIATGSPDDANKEKSITLTHAVAQVCFRQIDELDFAAATGNLLKVKFPQTYSFNVSDRTATELTDATGNSIAKEIEFTADQATKDLGTIHLIARGDGAAEKTVMDITTEFKASATATPEAAKTITNIPLRANFKTSITGAYSDIYSSSVTISCDENWNANYNEEFPRLANVGDFYYKDGSYGNIYKENIDNPCIGIVFWVNPADKTHGKIVALDEIEGLPWGKYNHIEGTTISSVASLTDGATATKDMINAHKDEGDFATVYSTFNYVYQTKNNGDINGRWYIPALHESQYLLCARKGASPTTWEQNPDSSSPTINGNTTAAKKFKEAMEMAKGTAFNESRDFIKAYWTSSETAEGHAIAIYNDGSFEQWGYNPGNDRLTRCISQF